MKTIPRPRGAVPFLAFFIGLAVALATPTRVNDLRSTQITGTTISIAWTAPTPGTGSLTANDVRISSGPINALNWTSATRLSFLDSLTGTPGTLQTSTLTGLTPGTPYYIAMKVQDTSGNWTSISSMPVKTTLSTTVPSVEIQWQQSLDPYATGYKVYWGVSTDTYTNHTDVGNVTEATIPNLVNGVTYYITVTAYGSVGYDSPYANEVTYTTPADP